MNIEKEFIFTSKTLTQLRRWVLIAQFIFVNIAFSINAIEAKQLIISSIIISTAFIFNQLLSRLTSQFQSKLFAVFFDLLILFSLLFVNGGYSNPFLILILLHYFMAPFFLNMKQNIFFHGICVILLYLLHRSPFMFTLKDSPFLEDNMTIISILLIGITIWAVSLWIFNEIKKLHQNLSNLAVSSGQIDKYRALGFLTAGVCHELGTPLNTLKLSFDELKADLAPEDEQMIERNINRCIKALKELNNHVHDADSQFYKEQTNIVPIIKDVIESYKQNTDLEFNFLACDILTLNIRIPKLVFVRSLLDIFDNAKQASASAVEIKILSSETIDLIISDNGIGFPTTHLELLGTPFFTTKDSGTGLGLYHLKNLINLAGGHIRFHNEAGAKITIQFPKADL